ncbi:MAG: hypothetical protein LIP08_04780 [Bacteroides sp.]|nr:hypothetical protein [Bacteroides sp.]
MIKQKILIVHFRNPLSPHELPQFRGAIIHATENADILFHNHAENQLRYAYPLIQYKRIRNNAAIVCIGEGTEAIGDFFSSRNFDVNIGNRKVTLEIEAITARQEVVQVWDSSFSYHINKWLPLNQENYARYRQSESLAERYTMLEKILTGNILSFAKGVGIRFEKQIICQITEAQESYSLEYKKVRMTTFHAKFKSNVSLPSLIGLGKGVSQGFGTIYRQQ